jgi:archaellum component FlaF (FlaF/FlaG flagellin family)
MYVWPATQTVKRSTGGKVTYNVENGVLPLQIQSVTPCDKVTVTITGTCITANVEKYAPAKTITIVVKDHAGNTATAKLVIQ